MIKKIFKVIGLMILFIILVFGFVIFFEVKENMQEMKKLEKEVEEISDIVNATEFDEKAYKKHLNKTVTTGEIYKVERAYKNWLRDYLKTSNEIEEFYAVLGKGELLSEETIVADGKSFTTLRATLNAYSNKLDNLRDKYNNLSDEDYVITMLPIKHLTDKIGVFTVKGYGKMVELENISCQGRGGKGQG